MGRSLFMRAGLPLLLSSLLLTLLLSSCGEQFDSVAGEADAGSDGGICIPTSCEKLGAECGIAPNGCGETVDCGSCPQGEVCGGGGQNKCGKNSCTPRSCAELNAECGVHSDGCGATIGCGDCVPPATCGGGGTPNRCGCRPLTCTAGMCGDVPDGCGDTLQCGGCPSGKICGGGGPNTCGDQPCTPTTCAAEGRSCGTISDGCGGALLCGTCTPPQTCGGGNSQTACGCTPKTCVSAGKNCGQIPDGCGNMLNCGNCTSPQTCGGAGTPNVCGCTPACQANWCGVAKDGCGNTVLCPVPCGNGYDCNLLTHQCVACVVGVCPGSPTKCVAMSPCDGTNYIPVHCPCSAGKVCDLDTGNCI